MARTIGDVLAERIDTGGLNAAAVDALLAEFEAKKTSAQVAWLYGIAKAQADAIARAAAELVVEQYTGTAASAPAAEGEVQTALGGAAPGEAESRDTAYGEPSGRGADAEGAATLPPAAGTEAAGPTPAVDPVLLLTAWTCVAQRIDQLCDRVEELRDIPEKPDRAMTAREREVWELLRRRGAMQAADILEAVGSTGSNVRRILRNLRGFGVVVKAGVTQSAYYAAVAGAPGTAPGERAPRQAEPKAAKAQPAARAKPDPKDQPLTEGEAKLLRALIRKPAAPLPDLCKTAGLGFGQANGLYQSLRRKGYLATEGGQRRILRRPDGQPMPKHSEAQLQAQVEAMAAAGRVTKCPTRFVAESQAGDGNPAAPTSNREGRAA